MSRDVLHEQFHTISRIDISLFGRNALPVMHAEISVKLEIFPQFNINVSVKRFSAQ